MYSFLYVLRRVVFVCALLLSQWACCDAQTHNAKKTGNDTTLIHRLFAIASKQTNPDSAMPLLKVTLQMAVDAKYDLIIQSSLLKIGEIYLNKGDWAQAIVYMQQALPYAISPEESSNNYFYLGCVYFNIGDYTTSAENCYAALKCLKKNDIRSPSEVGIYGLLGMVYFRLHENERSLSYFNLGEALARQKDLKNYIATILLSKGEYYTGLNKPDSARKCYNEAIDIADKISRADLKAEGNEGIGKTFIESGDYQKAVYYLRSAITISEHRNMPMAIDASYYLGEAFYRLKKYKEAEAILVPALKKAAESKLKDNNVNGYTTLAAVYKATGQYAKAVDCMDSIGILKDSLVSAEKMKAINLMDIKYQTAEKDKEIAQQNNKIARKNLWILFIGSSVILLLLVSVGVYFYHLNKQRSLEKENRIGILNAVVQGGDNERTRIARDLHDGIGGMLSAAMIRFSSMKYDNSEITQTPAYKETMNILYEMGDEIRKTAHNLMPEVLLKQSLPDAVRVYCSSVQGNTAFKIDFQSYGSFDDLTDSYKLNLYRIVQELVKNVIMHAKADQAMVQLMRNEDLLIVSVEDNGGGFNMQETKAGQGLHNTRSRVSSMDGKFTLESTPGEGTSVFIEFNMQNIEKQHG